MGSGAANMRALSRQIEQIPDAAVAELVAWFVPRSEQIGGKMIWYGDAVQLSSKLRRQRHTRAQRRSNAVVLGGTPAGAWSVKSYGRRGDYDVVPRRRQALSIGAVTSGIVFERAHIDRATHGDGRWDRLVIEADQKFPDVAARFVERAVAHG